ncbi:50S ribosomal protein L19-2, chloroplastic-like [Chenopodium quinoa]|uniref:50S ribosomal protein L19-2, chloroplastic-like n=1 Tax=Chenopodium quinoa TaxID=63459 RepID=UPI000B77B203|nr:50S ribosomal protein L19-2, chloroplastic-like [Chenopodium quinoa]
MQSLIRTVRSKCRLTSDFVPSNIRSFGSLSTIVSGRELGHECASKHGYAAPSFALFSGSAKFGAIHEGAFSEGLIHRCFSTAGTPAASITQDTTAPEADVPARIKFKRLDKTARHIMQILDKEAVEEVKGQREIPDIKPGYIIQLKLEVPENKRRITTIKGIVIARRNAGLNSTFRIRRLVAGVGVESLLPMYSPNIKEIKVLDKKKVRRAKLYYLREKMNPLKK